MACTSSGCGKNCTADCRTNCKGECYTGCVLQGSGSTCSGCSSKCTTSCRGLCAGGCTGICVNNCDNGCTANCTVTCDSTCRNGCKSTCSGTCSNTCNNTCSGTCSNTCNNTCSGTCSNTCNTTCKSTCKGKCNSGCTGNGYADSYTAMYTNASYTTLSGSEIYNLHRCVLAAYQRKKDMDGTTAAISVPGKVGTSVTAAGVNQIRTDINNLGLGISLPSAVSAGGQVNKSFGTSLRDAAKAAYDHVFPIA